MSAVGYITCAACRHRNGAHRGYCASCGTAIQQVCRGCRFVNEQLDHYCGGCGSPLAYAAATVAPVARPAMVAPVPELTDLFSPTSATSPDDNLPSAGITQGDLDKLFGARP